MAYLRLLFVTFVALLLSIFISTSSVYFVLAKNDNDGGKEGNNERNTTDSTYYYLNEESVVFITGAAGFLGSELAMALVRTYNVKKVICVDRMDRGFGIPQQKKDDSTETTTSDGKNNRKRRHEEHELHLFEFKRQRLFRVLQTGGDKIHFYRIDFRPSIPEYFDSTEVPVMHHIFTRDHPDITHVVHFADHYHRGTTSDEDIKHQQVVPRVKNGEKAGMIEALFEQIRIVMQSTGKPQPHFLYASSADVYDIYSFKDDTNEDDNETEEENEISNNRRKPPNPPPFREHLPITTASSIAGTTKLIDEMLAQMYFEIAGIKSVGLRFFSIYGPWSLTGSPIFEMAEAVVASSSSIVSQSLPLTTSPNAIIPPSLLDHVKDYCYIDDAIDAVMAAMQFNPPTRNPSIVFNVGSGEGTTLRSIAKIMKDMVPSAPSNQHVKEDFEKRDPTTVSVANLDRSKAVLGFEPQVSLRQGLEATLAWHYDRAFPYGTGADVSSTDSSTNSDANKEEGNKTNGQSKEHISRKGIVSCLSPYDDECLKGNIAFPCSSECSHPQQCISTIYDDVLELSRAITAECYTVMYTVSLDPKLNDIPSIHVRASSKSIAYVQDGGGYCNIAFVAESSPLFRHASATYKPLHEDEANAGIIKYGFWTLIPLAGSDSIISTKDQSQRPVSNGSTPVPSITRHREILEMIPKLSPSFFFGAKVERAIYCDTDIIFDSVPRLLQEASMQPKQPDGKSTGVTVMLVGKREASKTHITASTSTPSFQTMQQESAYRTIRMAVIDEMMGDGFSQLVDSSFIVHNYLHQSKHRFASDEDAKFFRCDILGEVLTWNVPHANTAIEFILSLHDMWSRIMVDKVGSKPWWVGDNVTTIPAADAGYYHDIGGTNSKKKSSIVDDLRINFGDLVMPLSSSSSSSSKKQSQGREATNKVRSTSTDDKKSARSHRRLEAVHDEQNIIKVVEKDVVTSESRMETLPKRDNSIEEDKNSNNEEDTTDQKNIPEGEAEETAEDDDDAAEESDEEQVKPESTEDAEHNGFGVMQGAIKAVFNGIANGVAGNTASPDATQRNVQRFVQPNQAANEQQGGQGTTTIDDFVVNDDAGATNGGEDDDGRGLNKNGVDTDTTTTTIHQPIMKHSEDLSSYDVWMGILSSTKIKYFSRIVSMESVGAYRIEYEVTSSK